MREIDITHKDLGNNKLTLLLPRFFGSAKLYFNGRQIEKTEKKYYFTDKNGTRHNITLKPNLMDPIPKVLFNEEEIKVSEPLKWFEYVWMGIPILLAFSGGLLGALFGVLAIKINSDVFRSDKNNLIKYGFTLIINVIITLAFFIIAAFYLEKMIKGE